jgi:hypothetical protein
LTTGPTCSTTETSASPVGTYPVTCSGAVDADYSIAYVAGTVMVTPTPLTITASSGSYTFGGAVPTITPGYSGFVNGDTATKLTTQPTCSTTATSASSVGSSPYPSSCMGAVDSNYTINYVSGQITENPAPLTITANNATMTAGSSLPAFTVTYTGFVNGNTAANLSGTLVCTTTATSASPAGTYPITCSGQSSPNYTITYVAGTLTITGSGTQGTPIASVSPASINFGTVNLGTITVKSVTVTNEGTAPMMITDPFISILSGGDSKEFVAVNLCPKSLAAGKSCTIDVTFLAGPNYTLQTATLSVVDNAPGSPQTVALSATVINPKAGTH